MITDPDGYDPEFMAEQARALAEFEAKKQKLKAAAREDAQNDNVDELMRMYPVSEQERLLAEFERQKAAQRERHALSGSSGNGTPGSSSGRRDAERHHAPVAGVGGPSGGPAHQIMGRSPRPVSAGDPVRPARLASPGRITPGGRRPSSPGALQPSVAGGAARSSMGALSPSGRGSASPAQPVAVSGRNMRAGVPPLPTPPERPPPSPRDRGVPAARESGVVESSPAPFATLSGRGTPPHEKPWPQVRWGEPVPCHKWTLHMVGPQIGWQKQEVIVRIDLHPFAEGNIRQAFHGLDYGPPDGAAGRRPAHIVMKQPGPPKRNAKGVPEAPMKPDELWSDVESQTVARQWAEVYNTHSPPKRIQFLPCWILKMGSRLMACEPYIAGEYRKHNNNWGYVNPEVMRNTPHAFSHFTWHYSKGKLLIVDIQGVQDIYTDPQIHTMDGESYGVGNMGVRGIQQFFDTHFCNDLCRSLKLNSVKTAPEGASGPTMWNQRS